MAATELSPFDVTAFLAELRSAGCALGEPFHYFTTTTSTNDEAKRLANGGAPHGTTCFADFQTSGRGRQGKSWQAQPNAQLLTSIVLRGSNITNDATLTLAVGVALHRALQSLLPGEQSLCIKWPNDIEANGRKLAGILTESHATGDAVVTVVGIGLNVWEPPSLTPLVPQPIALRSLGLELARETLMVQLLQALEGALSTFHAGGLPPFVQYLNQFDALNGATVSIDGLEGRASGIAPDGSLLLATANGIAAVSSGNVVRTPIGLL